jgi:hypothetical protein
MGEGDVGFHFISLLMGFGIVVAGG